MKKITKLFAATLASLMIFAGSAHAHVTVNPGSSAPEAWETYTIKVPVEKESSTTKVALKIPEGITFSSYQPVPGWKVTTEDDTKGHVKTVTWEATADGIAAGQFQQFTFVAQNPKDETNVAWDAFQYYDDGEIVEWSGEEGSDLPHSVTEITASKSSADSAGHEHHEESDHTHSDSIDNAKESTETEDDNDQTLIISLGVLSLIISIIALLVALRKNKK